MRQGDTHRIKTKFFFYINGFPCYSWLTLTILFIKGTTQKLKFREQASLNRWTAAGAAKSLQSCPTLCDRIDGSPPASPIPGILQARALEWVAISFSNASKWKVKVKSLSRVDSSRPRGLQPTRLLHPWDFPGESTGVGCHGVSLPSPE